MADLGKEVIVRRIKRPVKAPDIQPVRAPERVEKVPVRVR